MLIDHPHVPGCVLGNRKHISARNALDGSKPAILQITKLAKCGDPNSPAIVLKKRVRMTSVQFSVSFGTPSARNRDFFVFPSVQSIKGGKPHASIFVSQNGNDDVLRQALFHSKRGDGKITKPVKAAKRRYPNIAFTILKEGGNIIARKSVGRQKRIRPSLVYVHDPPV